MFEFSMSSRVDHWAGICNDVFSFSVNVPLRYWISCGAGITDYATGFVFVREDVQAEASNIVQ